MRTQFFQTPMGKKFYEGTMVRIADSLERLSKEDKDVLDISLLKDPYVYLNVPDSSLYVRVKLDHKGISVEIFDASDTSSDEPLTWITQSFQAMLDGNETDGREDFI